MEKSVHEFGSVGTVIDSSVGTSECMCVLRWECGEKLLNRCYQGCNTKRQRAINNAMTCLISVLDCLAPFTAAYRVCVCVWSVFRMGMFSGCICCECVVQIQPLPEDHTCWCGWEKSFTVWKRRSRGGKCLDKARTHCAKEYADVLIWRLVKVPARRCSIGQSLVWCYAVGLDQMIKNQVRQDLTLIQVSTVLQSL